MLGISSSKALVKGLASSKNAVSTGSVLVKLILTQMHIYVVI